MGTTASNGPADYLQTLGRSGLLSVERLASLVGAFKLTEPDPVRQTVGALSRFLIDAGALTSWQDEMLKKGRFKGFFLGDYKLLSHLGSSGLASVYLAAHVHTRQQVHIRIRPAGEGPIQYDILDGPAGSDED